LTRATAVAGCCGAIVVLSVGCGGGHRHAGLQPAVSKGQPAVDVTAEAVGRPPAESLPDLCDPEAVEVASRDPGRSPSERRFLRRVARELRAARRDELQPGAFKSGCSSMQIPARK
jgi:hypothetical protein